jgi:vitamin B12 transporter
VIRRAKIIGLLGILWLPATVSGQLIIRDTARFSLDEVTITATRIPQDARQFTRITRIIPKTEIATSPARDLAELLEYLPDIDVRQRGPGGVQADISLRGGTFDQFAVLVNGINFSDPQTGHFQMDIPIPLSMIERIEVLSGSDVKSLGSNAFTGAINIVTAAPGHNRLHAGISGGSHGYLETAIDGGTRKGSWWLQSGALYQKSSGYRENTDFNTLNGLFQTGYDRKRFNLSLMAGGLKKAFGANSFYTARYPNQFEKTGTAFSTVQLDHSGLINIRQSFYYRIHSDEFSLFRSDPPAWYLSPNYHWSQTAGSKTDAWFTTVLGKTAFGLEIRHESIFSTVLGDLTESPRPVRGAEGMEYTRYGSRIHYSLSAEQQAVTGRIKWNGGVVLHAVRSARNYLQAYPGLDISYSASANLRTFLSVNRAFRLPTFTELYYKSPTNQGNAGLLPETAWHAETGAEYRSGGFTARLTGFYRHASQSIDWVRADHETIWHTENLGKINTGGMETGVSFSREQSSALPRLIDRLDIGFRRYFQHHSVESYHSQYVLDYLKWKMTAGLTLKIGDPFRLTTNLVWQERNGSYTAFGSDQSMNEVDYKPFMFIDIKLSYNIRRIRLIAGCTNVLNTTYFDIGSVPQPGAWFKAGIEINLSGKQ